jgi:hypothetical protein
MNQIDFNRSRSWFSVLAMLAALGAVSRADRARAAFFVHAAANAGDVPESSDGMYVTFAQDSGGESDGFSSWDGFASAGTSLGSVHLDAGGAGHGFAGGGGDASGSFHDELTISNAALTGQAGTFVAQMRINGELLAASLGSPFLGTAHASMHAELSVDSPAVGFSDLVEVNASQSSDDLGNIANTGPLLPYVLEMNVPFVFGQPFSIEFGMGVSAGGSGSGAQFSGGIGRAQFIHSGDWAGVDEVQGPSGDPVDFLLTSESGIDYTQPIPEPGTMLLMLAAGLAIWPWAFGRRTGRINQG